MNKWNPAESAPRDGRVILADVGYPWTVMAAWNGCDERWVYAMLQADTDGDEWNDTYFENETAESKELKAWMPLPEINHGR